MASTSPLYVREAMIAPQKPPSSAVGPVKWARENLFSSPLNTLLTVLALYAVYFIVTLIGPWLLRAVWDADSLQECRAIAGARYGDGVEGACLALIRERWNQLLFGFYPRELYWRPVLAFLLLLAALAPALFSAVPRKLLWLSALYPAVAFWLLWGGSVWLPVSIVLGLAVAGLAGVWVSSQRGLLFGALAFVAAFLAIFLNPVSIIVSVLGGIASLVVGGPVTIPTNLGAFDLADLMPLRDHFAAAMEAVAPIGMRSLSSDSMGGFMLSLTIGISGITFSLPLGILLALGRQSDMVLVKTICVGFIEIIRGVPLITLLFTASLLLNYFLPPGTSFDIILRVIIMVTIFAAAYMAEVIRGGLAALPRGQYEAADALGLNYWQAQRQIIMPQALKVSIPSIVGNFIGLFKDTTLVIFIGLQDPLALVSAIRADTAWSGTYWEPLMFVAALFFIVCFSMSRYSMYLEKKLKTDHR